MKTCKTCELKKPYNEYTTCKAAKDGYAYVCNGCRAEYELQRRIKNGIIPKPKPKIIDGNHKECLKCHKIFHINKFPNAKRGRLGKGSYCVKCNKKYHKIRKDDPSEKERSKKATQLYRDKHREHWRALHRINQYNRKKLVKAKSDGTITEKFMQELYATTHCCWCNKFTPPDKRTAEHVIPLAKGGIHGISNLKMACLNCNSSKLNFI